MKGRYFRWLALAGGLSLAACGGSDAAPDSAAPVEETGAGHSSAPAGPPPTVDVSGKAAPEPEKAGPTPIVRSKADAPSRPSPAGQGYADCMAQARAAGAGEREVLERTCARLPDAPKN